MIGKPPTSSISISVKMNVSIVRHNDAQRLNRYSWA